MRLKRARGLSLLEVVVAVSLLSGVLFTLGILIPRSVMHLRNKGFCALAAQLAENFCDDARGLDSAQIPSQTFDGSKPLVSGATSPLPPDPAVYAGEARQFPPLPYPSKTCTVRADGKDLSTTYYFKVAVGPPVRDATSPAVPTNLRTMQVSVYWMEPGASQPQSYSTVTELGP